MGKITILLLGMFMFGWLLQTEAKSTGIVKRKLAAEAVEDPLVDRRGRENYIRYKDECWEGCNHKQGPCDWCQTKWGRRDQVTGYCCRSKDGGYSSDGTWYYAWNDESNGCKGKGVKGYGHI